MPKKAQATKEGKTWSMRRRVLGQDFYVSGHRTKTEAEQEMKDLVDAQAALGKPKGFGPLDTTVAQALQEMALERLKFLKSAVKDANRINRWLRAAGLATLKVTPWAQSEAARKSCEELGVAPEDQGVLFCVTLEPLAETRRIPRGLVSGSPHGSAKRLKMVGCHRATSKSMRCTLADVVEMRRATSVPTSRR